MQPAGGVGDDQVGAARHGGVERVVDDRSRVGARRVRDDRDLRAFGPDPQLVDGGGAERVRGGEDDRPALADVARGELADRRRLARAVDPDDEHDRRPAPDRWTRCQSRSRVTSSARELVADRRLRRHRDRRRLRARSTTSIASAAPTSPAMSVSSTSSHCGPSALPRYPRSRDMNPPRVRSRPSSRVWAGATARKAVGSKGANVGATSGGVTGSGAAGHAHRRSADLGGSGRLGDGRWTAGPPVAAGVVGASSSATDSPTSAASRGRLASASTVGAGATSGSGASSWRRRQNGISRPGRARAGGRARACASSRRRLMTRLTESSPTVTP